jgi:hypothetical protein
LIYLITFICLLIALALFAGAFYLAKYVVGLQHRNNVLEDSYKEATDYIKLQEEHIITLKQEIDFMRRTEEAQSTRTEPQRTWNPGDPLNSGRR